MDEHVTPAKEQLAQQAASYNPEPTVYKPVTGDPTGVDMQVGGNTTINAAVEGRGDNPNGVAVYTTPGQVPVDNEHPGDGENPEGTPHPDGASGVDAEGDNSEQTPVI